MSGDRPKGKPRGKSMTKSEVKSVLQTSGVYGRVYKDNITLPYVSIQHKDDGFVTLEPLEGDRQLPVKEDD